MKAYLITLILYVSLIVLTKTLTSSYDYYDHVFFILIVALLVGGLLFSFFLMAFYQGNFKTRFFKATKLGFLLSGLAYLMGYGYQFATFFHDKC